MRDPLPAPQWNKPSQSQITAARQPNRRRVLYCTALCSILLLVAGALSSRPSSMPATAYRDVLIKDVPHVKQKPDFCGEACAEMYLRKLGKSISQDYVFNQSDLDPVQGRGCYTAELAKALQRVGFRTGDVQHLVNAAKAREEVEAEWKALHADLLKGIPSIVCMHYDSQSGSTEHFRLILGYAAKADEVIYHEPAEQSGSYRRMKRVQFLELWPLKYNPHLWTVIRLRLEPGTIAQPTTAPAGFTNADYAQHIRELRTKIPKGFTIVLQAPFVVIGDEAAAMVKRRAEQTVKWAVDMLKRDYFTKDPDDILDVWLFKDKDSYEKHTLAVFRETPTTPFGYYSQANRALIMNIATGGGTLVHEIVHPFMRADFPECPPWFNEGLGSLYEQAGERAGHIIGHTNWRLDGLQKAIKADTVPSFESLTAMTDQQFYNQDNGTNYSQSRYLCYYLQEKGLLVRFYREFHASRASDPTGFKTLKDVLGAGDMDAFKKKWEAYVLTLRFP